MQIINNLFTYTHQTQLSLRFSQIIAGYRVLKVDSESDVGLIIVLRQHRTRKFAEITQK